MYGSYWSVTRYKDIMHVETHHQLYSSEARLGGITITDRPAEFRRRSFISSDPPYHDEQRKVVSPVVAPMNLQRCRAPSANGPGACWMVCRATRRSTGCRASRSS